MPLGIIPFPFGKCRICQDKATGVHYGVATCEGCKGFFKRSTLRGNKYKCYFGGECEITPKNRNRCKSCRYKRCLDVGMALDAVRMGRIPKVEKEKVLEVFQQCGSDYNKLELNVQQTDNGSYDFQINPMVEQSMDCDEPHQDLRTSHQGERMSRQMTNDPDESILDEEKMEIKIESQSNTEKESRSNFLGCEIPQEESKDDGNFGASASSQEYKAISEKKSCYSYNQKNIQSFNQGLKTSECGGLLNNLVNADIFGNSDARPSLMDTTGPTGNDKQLSHGLKQDISEFHMYDQGPRSQSSVNSSNNSSLHNINKNHRSFINQNWELNFQINEMSYQMNSNEDFCQKSISRQPTQHIPLQGDKRWLQKQEDPVPEENNGSLLDSESFSSGSLSFSNLNYAMCRTPSRKTVQASSLQSISSSMICASQSAVTSQEVSKAPELTFGPMLQPKLLSFDWSTSSTPSDSFINDTSGNQVSEFNQRNRMPVGMVKREGDSDMVNRDLHCTQTHHHSNHSENSPLNLQVTKEKTKAVNEDRIEYVLNELANSSDLGLFPVRQLEREDDSSPNTDGTSEISFRETNSVSSGSSSSSRFNSSLIKIMSDIITEASARQRLTERLKQILSSKDKVCVESVINLVQNELQNILSQFGSTNPREDKEHKSSLSGSKIDNNVEMMESKKRTLRRFLDDIKEFSGEIRPALSETSTMKRVTSTDREMSKFKSSSDLESGPYSQGMAVMSSSDGYKSERQEEIEVSLSSLNLAMKILYRLKPEHREKIKLLRLGKINIRIMTDSDEDVALVYERIITSIPMLNERIFGFCEHVPRFSGLCKDDKAKLMKRAYYDIWMLTFAEYFRDGKSEMILSTGEIYSIEAMRKILNDNMVDTMLHFAEQFNALELTDLEVSILCSIQLTKADGLDIEDRQNVLQIHSHLQSVFVYELERNHPIDHSQIITKIFQLLPLLEEINRLQKTIIAPFPTKYKKS